ncbi:hypothetical protein [Bovifimicola ammoniilytica]|jgi:uncharacterized protein with FMN-binding domain|uniref:hypothetical protein n=1 Tax=Bovifimicola ammoniilytica TaxID=2981720 RepID=UPI0008232802|nr:hypothetical protein [Bovifimicola ammoniilytica]MCU6752958.1 hypothetical protein [Bovifimicola ammoniilytica]SCJ46148.1 Uncharacterised protein [uncultured Eubacterium sp.]
MSNNPHIVVFKLKELIYTGIFVVLGILLIVLFINMFKSDKKKPSASSGEVNAANNDVSKRESNSSELTDSANATKNQDTQGNTDLANSTNISGSSETQNTSDNSNSKNTASDSETTYNPGVYTSSLMLNNSSLEIEVCVDSHRINSISVKNMDEAITTMYPLMKNSINDLSNQIINSQSLENITYTDDCKYTYMILLDAISTTLDKARK